MCNLTLIHGINFNSCCVRQINITDENLSKKLHARVLQAEWSNGKLRQSQETGTSLLTGASGTD